jgi:hypothetical protein
MTEDKNRKIRRIREILAMKDESNYNSIKDWIARMDRNDITDRRIRCLIED